MEESAAKAAIRPAYAYNRDNAFFGEGLREGAFRIQKCNNCGALRNPPRPMCPKCRSLDWSTIDASGRGTVYSYVVHHHPRLPGMPVPIWIVLVDLEEGVRAVGNLVGGNESSVTIGAPVELVIEQHDEDSLLAQWRLTEGAR